MANDQRNADVMRDGFMNLLSNDGVACVSTAETAERLLEGDGYVDLEQIIRKCAGIADAD
jgi:hypothetical protein